MEIHDRGSGEIGRRGLDRAKQTIDLTRSNRDAIQEAVRDATEGDVEAARTAPVPATDVAGRKTLDHEATEGDRVELSIAAHALAADEDAAAVAARRAKIAEIQRAIDAGELADPARIDRAATRLLRG